VRGGNRRLDGAGSYLGQGMDPGVGAARTLRQQSLPGDSLNRTAEQALHRNQARLHLPAVKIKAVIRQRDFQIARHWFMKPSILFAAKQTDCLQIFTKLYARWPVLLPPSLYYEASGIWAPEAPIPRTVCRSGGTLRQELAYHHGDICVFSQSLARYPLRWR